MTERRDIGRLLSGLEQEMKELEIAYEQYFAGVEKREPLKQREELARRLRYFANRRIIQTDLRFRYQNLATRFHSYSGYWDRILRLMDEGRYQRQLGPAARAPRPEAEASAVASAEGVADRPCGGVDTIYADLVAAHQSCNLKAPGRRQVEEFLSRQQELIRRKFGEREVEFRVETVAGKPKIKVTAKK